ncbi:Hypothetical_protein [Hexamita inflata]|uniref:Hypothetical_protein n=1 Tax=Hexamita inflata TaxID=28002 RepID=A0AA86P4K5_9EUKA|nr:Hypothetical protein HINF_LOCUS18205 [Hexamita inflata]
MKWKWKIQVKQLLFQSSINILFNAGPDQPLDSILQETKMHSLFDIENESDCNYLNYNSNQAKYQYFILSSRLRLKKKSSIVFRDQEIPKIVQIDQLKMNTEVLCRSSACATSYKLHIASVYQSLDPLILFSNQAQLPYIFEIKFSQISFVDQNVEINRDILNK